MKGQFFVSAIQSQFVGAEDFNMENLAELALCPAEDRTPLCAENECPRCESGHGYDLAWFALREAARFNDPHCEISYVTLGTNEKKKTELCPQATDLDGFIEVDFKCVKIFYIILRINHQINSYL